VDQVALTHLGVGVSGQPGQRGQAAVLALPGVSDAKLHAGPLLAWVRLCEPEVAANGGSPRRSMRARLAGGRTPPGVLVIWDAASLVGTPRLASPIVSGLPGGLDANSAVRWPNRPVTRQAAWPTASSWRSTVQLASSRQCGGADQEPAHFKEARRSA